jgi:hypothetical protein
MQALTKTTTFKERESNATDACPEAERNEKEDDEQ